MYRNIKNKTLVLILAVLIIFTAIVVFIDTKKGDRSFRSQLIDVDTLKITKIVITPRSNPTSDIELIKKDNKWIVSKNNKEFSADYNVIKHILSTFSSMKPLQIAARTKDKWKEFEVTDSTATIVRIYKGKKKVSTLYIGRFNYIQPKNQSPYSYYYGQQGTMATYVRESKDPNVYLVEGFLAMTFNRDVNDFRNKTVIRFNTNDINKITFSYPDSSFFLVKDNNKWKVNDQPADSASVANYLSSMAWLNSYSLVDDTKPTTKPLMSVKFEGNNLAEPIEVKAYQVADTNYQFLINSSLNPENYFSGKDNDLKNRIFVGKSKFLKK